MPTRTGVGVVMAIGANSIVEMTRPPAAAHAAPRMSGPTLCVVVPTFNERDNVAELVRLLDATLAGIAWEVIFVDDDSPDGTAGRVRELGQADPRVRCIQRIGRRGLSSACIEGLLASSAPYLAVMDADLQHDETHPAEDAGDAARRRGRHRGRQPLCGRRWRR